MICDDLDTQHLTCYERSLQLVQYIFPEVSRRCCEEVFELFNYDLYHTIFYIRHNYYVYANYHSYDQDDKIPSQRLATMQAVNESTSNDHISETAWNSLFPDSSDDDEP